MNTAAFEDAGAVMPLSVSSVFRRVIAQHIIIKVAVGEILAAYKGLVAIDNGHFTMINVDEADSALIVYRSLFIQPFCGHRAFFGPAVIVALCFYAPALHVKMPPVTTYR